MSSPADPGWRSDLSGGQITPEVKGFLADYITSADQLDILLLLHSRAGQSMTAIEVSQAVFTVPTSATLRLEQLVARGLAASSGGTDPAYTYRPDSDSLAQAVDELASAYRSNRVGVIQLVFNQPTDPMQSFADAFRFKKGE
jgi:hypothetical protein